MKLTRRTVVLLTLILLATAAAIAASVLERGRADASRAVRSMTALPEFKVEDVRRIVLNFGSMSPLTLELQNGEWFVLAANKPQTHADAKKISELLDSLARTRLLRELLMEPREAELLALGDWQKNKIVADPVSGKPVVYYGCRLELFGSDPHKPLLGFMLGTGHYKAAEIIAGKYAMSSPDGRYLRLSDEYGKPHYFLTSRTFDQCFPLSKLWIENLRCTSVDVPERIAFFESGKQEPVWEVRSKGGPNYALTVPAKKKFQPQLAENKLKLLFGTFSRDIADSGVKFQPSSRLELVLANGFTYTLEMQNAVSEMQRFGRLSISFDPAKAKPAPGETAAAFEQRRQFLIREAEIEKKWFEGGIYVLQPNVINILQEIPGE